LVAIDGVGTIDEVQQRALDALQAQFDEGATDTGDADQSATG
jgi:hypothetical protein